MLFFPLLCPHFCRTTAFRCRRRRHHRYYLLTHSLLCLTFGWKVFFSFVVVVIVDVPFPRPPDTHSLAYLFLTFPQHFIQFACGAPPPFVWLTNIECPNNKKSRRLTVNNRPKSRESRAKGNEEEEITTKCISIFRVERCGAVWLRVAKRQSNTIYNASHSTLTFTLVSVV